MAKKTLLMRTHHWVRSPDPYDRDAFVAVCGQAVWGTRRRPGGYVSHRAVSRYELADCEVCIEKGALLALAETEL